MKIKAKINVSGKATEFEFDLHYRKNELPNNDYILNIFSNHYHMHTKRPLPKDASIIEVTILEEDELMYTPEGLVYTPFR